jgi:predicted HTH transcriptional regulator
MLDIQNILQYKENYFVEVKTAQNGIPVSLWESYSAFANTEGGKILLGVAETEKGLAIVGVSDPRNPTIFKMFALIDIGERSGSGVFNLVTLWSKMGWESPFLESNFETERSVLHIPVVIEDEENDNVPNNVPNNEIEREEKILLLIKDNNKISAKEIALLFDINEKTRKRDIAKLKAAGIIERIDGTRGYWRITKK